MMVSNDQFWFVEMYGMMYKIRILGYLLILGTYTVHATEGGTGRAPLNTPTANILHPLHGKKDYIKAVGATILNYASLPAFLMCCMVAMPDGERAPDPHSMEHWYVPPMFLLFLLTPNLITAKSHQYLLQSKFFFELTRRLHYSSPNLYYSTAHAAGFSGFFIPPLIQMTYMQWK